MCLYPKRYINKKYTATEKNGGVVPAPPIIGTDDSGQPIYDKRVLYIEIPCGQCEECRKQKTREWQVRLTEELKNWKYPYFITLTFSPKELEELCQKSRLGECNALCAYAVRHMLERYRKDHKKSLRHWLITELGHEGTERIHMHGLLFSNEPLKFEETKEKDFYTWKYWKYGMIYVGNYCTLRTINYIVKYINKIDEDHKGFNGQILASPGIGSQWLQTLKNKTIEYKYKPHESKDYYLLPNGKKIKLPKYYKNKIYSESEKELIWRDFMDRNEETIAGNTYNQITTDSETIGVIYDKARKINKQLGYGDNSKEWRKKPYNITKQMLQRNIKKKEEWEALPLEIKITYNRLKLKEILFEKK